jgi:SAM-dependent methyltransferase
MAPVPTLGALDLLDTIADEDDDGFDALFPEWARRVSRGNFTPLAIARRAVALLVDRPGVRVLDVGSGVGKVCLVGALTSDARFHGIEQRAHFVAAAGAAAAGLGLGERATFVCGDAVAADWRPFDAVYLFNPFAEFFDTLLDPFDGDADATDPIDLDRHTAYVAGVRDRLAEARPGTRVVTYAGFGGDFPAGYRLEHAEPARDHTLELWIRTASPSAP